MKAKKKAKAAKRPAGKKAAGKKPAKRKVAAKKTAAKRPAVKKPAAKASWVGGGRGVKPSARRSKPARSWLDDAAQKPVIEQYARQLDTFIETMADGQVDEREIEAQEQRLVTLMKNIEPELDADLHEKVTQLLCELTAYDIMQLMHAVQGARPKQVAWRG